MTWRHAEVLGMKKRLVTLLVCAVIMTPVGYPTASSSATIDVAGGSLKTATRLDNPTTIAKPTPPPTSTLHPELQRVLDLTNLERTSRGLAPLTHNSKLGTAAQLHSEDQASMRTLTHTGSDGSNPGDRITRAGYEWRTWAENAAAGFPTADEVMVAWMNNPGHRANLLSASVTEIGLGLAETSSGYRYWTQNFAAPR